MPPIKTNRKALRRYLLHTQHLLPNPFSLPVPKTPSSQTVLDMLRSLAALQLDPVSAVAPNQHLVLAARLPGYRPEMLEELLAEHKVFEYVSNAACVMPMEDYPLYEPVRERKRTALQDRLTEMEAVVQAVLARLQAEGPLPSRAFQSAAKVTGYWENPNNIPKTKDTSHALTLLVDAGIVRVVGRKGTERFFALTDMTVPDELLQQAATADPAAIRSELLNKYIQAYRVFDVQDPRLGWVKSTVSERKSWIESRLQTGQLAALEIEGVTRPYYMPAADVQMLQELSGQYAADENGGCPVIFLPPLDNLLWRRERLADLFNFHYRWEIYTPAVKRRYGYYAMPILYGDELIGRIDPRLDRKTGILTVPLLQLNEHIQITDELIEALRSGLVRFATSFQADHIIVEKTEPARLKETLSI
ncbi:winged helix-turn-helix domain-containing protein [Paenibacillus medicaginis]|uniref:Winged helix-turn-helix domain-containing protein n=1 Tax=Paenibacillus medicaginis TaxID=1470560 RepID=A0ABV5BU02_9BACL